MQRKKICYKKLIILLISTQEFRVIQDASLYDEVIQLSPSLVIKVQKSLRNSRKRVFYRNYGQVLVPRPNLSQKFLLKNKKNKASKHFGFILLLQHIMGKKVCVCNFLRLQKILENIYYPKIMFLLELLFQAKWSS